MFTRVFDIDTQHYPNCGGGELKIIVASLERALIEKILKHLGLEPHPQSDAAARRRAWLEGQSQDGAARRVSTTLSTSG